MCGSRSGDTNQSANEINENKSKNTNFAIISIHGPTAMLFVGMFITLAAIFIIFKLFSYWRKAAAKREARHASSTPMTDVQSKFI